ncbi:AAA family ATPase [Candidatus Mycoplasma mahonii]|uniref:AAA family ATPase n=1 Tax=Candidatus Mycoplasma mahonii TaxID=3004105 RepID=UPI0026ECA0C4|nr:AAA family ATPase [Candidatus Mycoplasma mahonii]WKX02264.1 AAA family ATPase [Candidatus Mycoplasma mahonii]
MNISLLNIKIKNFKSIKEVNFNLRSNTNKIEKEILLDIFKKTADGKYGIPSYVALFGINSIGKTTILHAITLISYSFNETIENAVMRNIIINKMDLFKNKKSSTLSTQDIQHQIKNEKGPLFQNWKEQTLNLLLRFHKLFSNDDKVPIQIELTLEVGSDVIDVLYTLSIDGHMSLSFQSENVSKFNKEDIIIEYLSNISSPTMKFSSSNNTIPHFIADINEEYIPKLASDILPMMSTIIGKKKLNKIIKLADPNFEKLVWINLKGKGVVEKIVTSGKFQSLDVLSTGTLHFINNIYRIISGVKSKNFKGGLVLIDEIETSLHKELINVLKFIMIREFEKNNTQFIFTTHNPLSVSSVTSKKQIYSLEASADKHIVSKLSKTLKPGNNLTKKYEEGFFSGYPDIEEARNVISDIF